MASHFFFVIFVGLSLYVFFVQYVKVYIYNGCCNDVGYTVE